MALPTTTTGALDGGGGGPQCRMSILRNGNGPCGYFCNFHVGLKIVQCLLSNLINTLRHVGSISHDDRLDVAF